jgi:hypothetical protein
MTAFTSLRDGGLSVKIAGVERVSEVHGLEWESTQQGDGEASFWVEASDPFDVGADYPELVHGASVKITHTLDSPTALYGGWVLTDPTVGSREANRVSVVCGGPQQVLAGRTDYGAYFIDCDPSNWQAHRRNVRNAAVNNNGQVDLRFGKKVGTPSSTHCAIAGYVPYPGASYLMGEQMGVTAVFGHATWDLNDDCEARLAWATDYVDDTLRAHYTILSAPSGWTTNTSGSGNFSLVGIGGASGAGYLVLMLRSTTGNDTTDERFITLDKVTVVLGDAPGEDATDWSIDEAMSAIATQTALEGTVLTVSSVGSAGQQLVCPPPLDPPTALANLAAQADEVVEWGWWPTTGGHEFRARPMLTSASAIRALANCYAPDCDSPGVVADIQRHPESSLPQYVRLLCGCLDSMGVYGNDPWPDGVPWPDGTVLSIIAPTDPGWSAGAAFSGAAANVLTVDFSAQNYIYDQALAIATNLASLLSGTGTAYSGGGYSGPLSVTLPTLPIYGGGAAPVPYIHGGDWVEYLDGPLYVTRAHVVADTGYCDMDLGTGPDVLLNQLIAQGAVSSRHHGERIRRMGRPRPPHPHHHHRPKPVPKPKPGHWFPWQM